MLRTASPRQIESITPRPFKDNATYLHWELTQVQARVRAYVDARDRGEVEAFVSLVEAQQQTRGAVRALRRALVEAGVEIALELLVSAHRLSALEEEVLLYAMAPHLSANTRQLLLHAQGGRQQHLEMGFLSELISPSSTLVSVRSWGNANAALVRHGLLRVRRPPGAPLSSRLGYGVDTPHYLAAMVTGEMVVDERLDEFAHLQRPLQELYEVILSDDLQEQVEMITRGEAQTLSRCRVLVTGPAKSGKSVLIEALAKQAGRLILTLDCEQLPHDGELPELLRLACHNASFYEAAWHILRPEALRGTSAEINGRLAHLIRHYPGAVLVETGRSLNELDETLRCALDVHLDVTPPDVHMREQLWESAIPFDLAIEGDLSLNDLASSFDLMGGQIRSAVEWAQRRAFALGSGRVSQRGLEEGARLQLGSKLADYTEASTIQLSLEHLILPEEQQSQVESLLAATRNRETLLGQWGFGQRLATGKGLVALFAGEPGTGKTLCAEILAQELGQTLRIVSLPQIVSKWVGETSKNMRELFREAQTTRSILLFDEADSLFSKRVKVERTQDHYQNMEVNNLLQEIERFDGVVFLTTNLEVNMDGAFARRILYKIHFPMPGTAQRAQIWRSLIPSRAPLSEEGIDFEMLAEDFELSGGQIKNAVVRAAYLSLERGDALNTDAMLEAAHQEVAASGRLTRVS